MNVTALSTLVAILERGSFAAAADEVGCTPSAVSLQIKQLEAYFGQSLFDRSARSVKPTAFASEAGAIARDLIGRLEALRARRSIAVAGRLRLGTIATIATDALPRALRVLRDRHSALDVEVSLNDSDALLSELRAGRIDAAALIRPQSGGSSRLLWQNLAKQPFVMLVPAHAPSSSPKVLLEQCEWIRYDTSLTGGRIAARYVRRTGSRARCVIELRSIDAIVAMVSAGLGVSVVPRPRQALLDAHAVREVRLGKQGATRQIALVRRSADVDSRNIDAVLQAFSTAYAGLTGDGR